MSRCLKLVAILVAIRCGYGVKVCRTFVDYYKHDSPNCGQNYDPDLNLTEIISKWGCHVEEYNITTIDGYKLLMVRAFKEVNRSMPIILGHGIYTNGLSFVYNYNKSLTYNLIFSGYEVFILNFRGTVYSWHQNLTKSDRAFWKFSFHQMGVLDFPEFINTIYDITRKKSIYIGYSMGTTVSYVYSSIYPTEASRRIKGFISLAPVASLIHPNSILAWLAYFCGTILKIFDPIWNGKILEDNEWFNTFCSVSPFHLGLCEMIRVPIFGDDFTNLDPLTFPVQYLLILDAISTQVLSHYAQIILQGKFQQFDFGSNENMKVYGTVKPPIYDISKINIPSAFIQGRNDWLANTENSKSIYKKLNTTSRCGFEYVQWDKWNHVDFLVAKNINRELYPLILSTIDRIDSDSCHHGIS